MECLEFRRRLMIDPLCKDGDLLEHEERCDECMAFARDLRRKEIRLRALMRSIEPSASMHAEVRGRIAPPTLSTPPSHYGAAIAMALLVAIATVWWAIQINTVKDDPAHRVLQHIQHEASHLVPGPAVNEGALKFLFDRFGARLLQDLGEVYFAAECLISTDTGVHLVLQGEQGPVTMLMMPGETLEEEIPIDSLDWHGSVTPTAWGSVAVVGRDGEPTDQWMQRLLDTLVWPHSDLAATGLAAR